MKKIFVLLLVTVFSLIALNKVKSQPPPFDPWLVNVSPANAPSYIFDLTPVVELLDTIQQPSACYDDDTECYNWSIWKFDTAIVVHPSYPGCPILINYRHRICQSNPRMIQHNILNYVIRKDIPGCAALDSYLKSGSTISQSEKTNQLEHDIYGLIAKQRFIEFNNHIMIHNDTLYCDDPPGEHMRISYVKGSCKGWCVGYYSYPTSSTSYATLYKPRNCDQDACCKVTNEFCIDRTTGQLVHNETTVESESPEECYVLPETLVDCYTALPITLEGDGYLESNWVIECTPTCDLEFLNLGGDQIID